MDRRTGIIVAAAAVGIIVLGGVFVYMGSKNNDDAADTSTTSSNSTSQKTTSENATTPPQNSEAQNSGNPSPVAPPAASETKAVTIEDMAFSPKEITVKVGTTVTWTNQDTVAHTVTSDSDSTGGPSSESLAQGKSYSFTFKKAGTYNYHCTPHPFMKGTVIVTD